MGTPIRPDGRPNGMASAAAALRYWERRQEVSANNLANASTGAFKKERVFSRFLQDALPAPDAVLDFTPGAVHPTGNPLDVAIEGQGFFVVQTQNGERLSRGGTFRIGEQGALLDASGRPVLGEHGPITITSRGQQDVRRIEISRTGIVRVDDAEVGRLRVETVADPKTLQQEGTGLFVPPAQRTVLDRDTLRGMFAVRQGALEDSNVSAITEMVGMIDIQRAYSAVQKAMSTLDAARGIATTELGRPGN